MSHTLLILLDGPMQSWGSRSRFDDRDTHLEPTKSAVIGLVCAAIGRGRGEPIDDLASLRFGVRIEEPGVVETDYQTAQNVISADGTKTSNVISRRHYLAGARFLVGLCGEDLILLSQIEGALQNPKWTLSLGRKSYPLAFPPYLPGGSIRIGIELEEALRNEPWRTTDAKWTGEKKASLRLMIEDKQGEITLADCPISFARREHGLRRASVFGKSVEDVDCLRFGVNGR